MKYTSIRIEGAILSADILDRIEQGDIAGQSAKDFGFDAKTKVKDEIARAWADAQDLWRIFNRQREKVAADNFGTSETRRYWILPLLGLLGYDVQLSRAEAVNGKSYAISHRAENLDGFPVHIVGFNDSLDKKRDISGPRMSPHALVQEYINLTEHYLYAIVTNGIHLRLIRDSSRLIKLSFIEFDLQTMMDDEHYADFAILFRLFHASRMPHKRDMGGESLMEIYHQDALESGSRIRDGLSHAVEFSIRSLANGFLEHPENHALREAVGSGSLSAIAYYQYQLRLIYRILFLLVIEERNLVFPENGNRSGRNIYRDYYSVNRLRRLCEKSYILEQRHHDLWISLKQSFRLFETEACGRPLGIKPLAGDLFGPHALGILNQCQLDNRILLECLKNLSVFQNSATGQKTRVNYAALNVEEFGSVYEGLLEYEPVFTTQGGRVQLDMIKGDERSSSGSHYTPDEMVKPLIKHSLDHIINERLKSATSPREREQALLSIKVCDVACGSGHILLNAARRIGLELAKVRTGEDQPSPKPLRQAIRDAISSCIYGVDKNPLAVDLCKVALWLEAHNPGEPLNFLDHHIKCGDAIVGLALKEELENGIPDEAFNKMPDDEKNTRAQFAKQNKQERAMAEQREIFYRHSEFSRIEKSFTDISRVFTSFNALPETSIDQIADKRSEYKAMISGENWQHLKSLCDIQTAQFFIPKSPENEGTIVTDGTFRQYMSGIGVFRGGPADMAAAEMCREKRVFHWFLEFPEVFSEGGFDCILGNPPFLGGQKLTGAFGQRFLEYVKYAYAPAGSCDLVTYFFRRIFTLLKPGGFQTLISTNTIAQGGAREGGLDVIAKNGGTIHFAVRSMKWPGLAAVEVALVGIYKGEWKQPCILGGSIVPRITPYLDDAEITGNPYPLRQNADKSFQGSIVLGKGFVLEPWEAQKLTEKNPKNKEVLFPYLNGEDLNTNPDQSPSRWVINFDERSEIESRNYCDVFGIVEQKVKPERMVKDPVKYPRMVFEWWKFWMNRKELNTELKKYGRVYVQARISKTHGIVLCPSSYVFTDTVIVFSGSSFSLFAVIQSSLHENWAWQNSSTMKGDRRYAPRDCFQTFPFPQNPFHDIESALEKLGEIYHDHRQNFMRSAQLGLTKTYNQFHNQWLSVIESDVPEKEIEKQFGKETLTLWNHLHRTPDTCDFNQAVSDILELRRLHREMDETVLKAYGWTDINLAHDFYEVDYLPENDRIRYTIFPAARKEILKRLLKLNHEINEQEVQEGATQKNGKSKKKQKAEDLKQLTLF